MTKMRLTLPGASMNLPCDRPSESLAVRPQQPQLVLAALRDNLAGLAGQLSDPALAAPLSFFAQIAGWAAAQAVVDHRAATGVPRVRELQAHAGRLGITADDLGDLTEALATAAAGGRGAAGEVLCSLLAELKAVEDAPVTAVSPSGGASAGPDVASVSAYLADRFGADARATAVTIIPGGYSKTTVLVEAFLDGHAQQIVLRQVPPGGPRDALKPEYDVLTAIWSPDMLIPEPLWLEETDNVAGGPFFASRRSPGSPLGTVAGAEGAAVPAGAIADLADFLAKLHSTDPIAVRSAPVLPMRDRAEILAAIDDVVARSRASVGEPSPRLRAALGWLRAHAPSTRTISIVHGDPGFQNTLAENGRMTAALDWERSHLGDAAEDLAYVMPSVSEVYDWSAFLEAYEAAGGRAPDEETLRFYLVWQDVWRHVECVRLGESFYSSGIFSAAIAGFVLGPQFLDSAVAHAFGASELVMA